jgi:hypothetical protein
MLSLNLHKIKTPHERFEQTYAPEQLGVSEGLTVAAPAALAFDIFKDNDQFRVVGDVKTTLELSCSRCLEPFELPIDQEQRRGRARDRGRRSDDGVLRERRNRSRAVDARAVLPRTADEAAMPRRLQGTVCGLRHEPQSRRVPVQHPVGRPALRGAEIVEKEIVEKEQQICRIPNDDIRKRGRPSAARTMRSRPSV